jgi:hypothetical protein
MTAEQYLLLDSAILRTARHDWQKLAMLVAKVQREWRQDNAEPEYELIAERVTSLVEEGRLESTGNLSDWRHSEVRLPSK